MGNTQYAMGNRGDCVELWRHKSGQICLSARSTTSPTKRDFLCLFSVLIRKKEQPFLPLPPPSSRARSGSFAHTHTLSQTHGPKRGLREQQLAACWPPDNELANIRTLGPFPVPACVCVWRRSLALVASVFCATCVGRMGHFCAVGAPPPRHITLYRTSKDAAQQQCCPSTLATLHSSVAFPSHSAALSLWQPSS